jgi:hypothetical protein
MKADVIVLIVMGLLLGLLAGLVVWLFAPWLLG